MDDVLSAADPLPLTSETARFGSWRTAALGAVGVWGASVVTWWLFFDPRWSPLHIYPEPAGAFIFWGILAVVWTAFNLQLWPSRLRQPHLGLLNLAITVVAAVAVTVILAYGWGQVDPAFSFRLPGGGGFGNGTYLVLMGFFFWSVIAVTWDHWPWADHGLDQPLRGTAELFVGLILSLFAFLALVYPDIATWTGRRIVPMQLNVTIGWFYSAIVALIFTAQFWENWPWSSLRSRPLRALLSLPGLLLAGTVIYFVSWAWLKVLVPPDIRHSASFSASQVAQLGVCVNSISLTWGLIAKRFVGRWPLPNRPKLCALLLTVGAYLAGSVVYLAYMRWAGTQLFHEPAVRGHYGGDPLLGVDWIILVLFWYAVSFDLYGLFVRRPRSAEAGAEPRVLTAVSHMKED